MRRSLRPYQRRYDPPDPAGLGRREETRRRAGQRLLLKEEPRTRAEGGFAITAFALLTGRAAGGDGRHPDPFGIKDLS
jgi:hypothetical protein